MCAAVLAVLTVVRNVITAGPDFRVWGKVAAVIAQAMAPPVHNGIRPACATIGMTHAAECNSGSGMLAI